MNTVAISSQPRRTLWPIRWYYFFFYMANGAILPFLSPYLREACGFDDRLIGIVQMLSPIIGLLTGPLWSFLGDRSGKRPTIAAILLFSSAATLPLILGLKAALPIILLLMLHSVLYGPIMSLADSIALKELESGGRSDRFGRLRVWGTIGFMAGLPLLGTALDSLGMQYLFPFFSLSMVVAGYFILRIPPKEAVSHKDYRSGMQSLLKDRTFRIFMVVTLTAGISNRMAFAFLSLHAKQLGASNTAVSMLWVTSSGAEALLLPFLPQITRRFGMKWILVAGLLLSSVRWFLTGQVDTWWHLLPLQLLHAFTLGFVIVGGLSFVDRISPSTCRSSAQVFYALMMNSISGIVGSLLAGEIAQRFNYGALYSISAVLAIAAAGTMALMVPSDLRQPVPATE